MKRRPRYQLSPFEELLFEIALHDWWGWAGYNPTLWRVADGR